MPKYVLPLILVAAAVMGGLYFFVQNGNYSSGTAGSEALCKELTEEEIKTIVGAFLKKQGYENFGVRTISPLYCSFGVGVRNIVADITIDKGLPTQHNKVLRLQIRVDKDELKIYEVVLTRPV